MHSQAFFLTLFRLLVSRDSTRQSVNITQQIHFSHLFCLDLLKSFIHLPPKESGFSQAVLLQPQSNIHSVSGFNSYLQISHGGNRLPSYFKLFGLVACIKTTQGIDLSNHPLIQTWAEKHLSIISSKSFCSHSSLNR